VGAGNGGTAPLVEGLLRRATVLPLEELVLHDVSAEPLGAVAEAASRLLEALGRSARVRLTTDLDEAVTGARAVVVQLRPDRPVTERAAAPSGLATALVTVPAVLDVADRARRLGEPGAWIVALTAPVGVVTRALLDAGHRAIGVSDTASGLRDRIAERLSTEPARLSLGHAGVHGAGWIRSVALDGVDRLPELLEGDHLTWLSHEVAAPPGLLTALGAVPLPRRSSRGRSGEAAADLVAGLLTGDGVRRSVSLRGGGVIDGLSPEAVVEIPARVDIGGAHPLPVPPLPPEMLGPVQHLSAYESLAVRAAVTGDRIVALRALLAHPHVPDWESAVTLLGALPAPGASERRSRR
jgi:6-phospho-beta-glucosidase